MMLISSKGFPTSLAGTDARVVGGDVGTLSGAVLCISRTRIRFRDLRHRCENFGRRLGSARVRPERHGTARHEGRGGEGERASRRVGYKLSR